MGEVAAGISIPVDGYIAGPNDGPGCGLGVGGERLHIWVFGTPRYDVGLLIYSALASLDGCIENRQGEFAWATPDEEVFRFLNNLERTVGTYLYGRRMYETMVYWETAMTLPDRRRSRTSRGSGEQPKKSSTRGRSRPCRARGRGSRRPSIPQRSGMKATAEGTSPWVGRISPDRRSPPASWINSNSSWFPSSSGR